jgi:hypothetical protein
MHDAESTAAKKHALTDVGVRFAIDDCGTGYFSLSYLKRFPVETLKIDRSFVEGLRADSQAPAIVARGISLPGPCQQQIRSAGTGGLPRGQASTALASRPPLELAALIR